MEDAEGKLSNYFYHELIAQFDETEMTLGLSSTKIVKRVRSVVHVGQRTRKEVSKGEFRLSFFAQGHELYIWYNASSTSSLPKLFKLCSRGQNWPRH